MALLGLRVQQCAEVTWADKTFAFSLQPLHSFDANRWRCGWTNQRVSTKDYRSAIAGNSDTDLPILDLTFYERVRIC